MNLRDLRAPEADGGILAESPLSDIAASLERNRGIFQTSKVEFLGRSLASLRREARAAALDAARAYHAEAGEPIPQALGDGILVAGHQPELFHPGVWLKNFALNAQARRHGLSALNLVVDNDAAKNALVRVPAEDHLAAIPFDHWQGGVPYEERRVLDEKVFTQFAEQVDRHAKSWSFRPLLHDFWAEVMLQARRTPLLGERFAAARRTFERAWGCHNFEVPLSRLCQTEPFAWFACHLLQNLPRFHGLYNRTVSDYRSRYGLRSRNHPVPDLAREGDWLEMPMWSWRVGQARRQRLFARAGPAEIQLRSGTEAWPSLRNTADPAGLVVQWLDLEKQGKKIRTRALTTTLFARLFLADLFMHGLGGGKYDELSDNLMRAYFAIEPPIFQVLTGTLRLPFPPTDASADARRKLARERRDTTWNPQRHLSEAQTDQVRLVEEKQRWIDRPTPTHAERLERFEQIRRINAELSRFVEGTQRRLETDLEELDLKLRVDEARQRRDFALCLYPADKLRHFLTRTERG